MASLRSYYCQLRSQYKSVKTKSGRGTADIKKPTWPFFDSLKFLDDNLTVKGTSSSINLSEVSQFKKKSKEVNRCQTRMTVCSYHVTYAFQSESTLYSCLNVKELLARNRREI